jgi:8-oxo-dGTP diphosphatase
MIEDGDRILLLNRPSEKGFPGYIAPGGKVDFPESIVDGAIREVKEETGLSINEITYKGLVEYCDISSGERYMVFHYLSTSFEGRLLEHPPEGELLWVDKNKLDDLPMQKWFRERIELFFKPGIFEKSTIWNKDKKEELQSTRRQYT